MNRLLSILLLLGLAWPVPIGAYQEPAKADTPAKRLPAGPVISVPAEVQVPVGRMARIVVTTAGKGVSVVNVYLEQADLFREYDPDATKFVYRFQPYAAGKYRLAFVTSVSDLPSDPAYCVVTAGDVPPGPVPPGPGPTPTPDPTPSVAPIPIDGLAVLIVEESGERTKLSKEQQSILAGKKVRDYLEAKCAKDPHIEGRKAYYILDPDTALTGIGKTWVDAMARKRGPLPWVVISNGKTGTEEPLPKTVAEMISLLEKFGGK